MTVLQGVGPKVAAALARRLRTQSARCLDLVLLAPNGKIDTSSPDELALAVGQTICLEVEILAHRPAGRPGLPHLISATTAETEIDLVFFRARKVWLEQRFPVGSTLRLMGRIGVFRERYRMTHPVVLPERAQGAAAIGQYAKVQDVSPLRLEGFIAQALSLVPALPEWLDEEIVADQGWPSWQQAVRLLHASPTPVALEAARRRLACDEILAFQLALHRARATSGAGRAPVLHAAGMLGARLLASLPFAPTGDQHRAIGEITQDLARPAAMRRLLQGDVGSGKTLVGLAAMLHAVEAGAQAVLMAPTELLARQHHRTLAGWLQPLGVEIGLLTGEEPKRARRAVLDGLAAGELMLAVGTHALFQPAVAFKRLGLVVIDEQHRFGVDQRARLLEKAGEGVQAHLLAMTATPIPRTLLLSVYRDLSTSNLKEKPAGRQPIGTTLMSAGRIEAVIAACGRALANGAQIYWVCPAIEEADEGVAAAEERHATLAEAFGETVGLVHGRQPAIERDARLRAFVEGKLRLLVATTVIEVGVDVPSASVMIIDGAERFGLAQLHQLRGRVGRGSVNSHCLLLYGPKLGAMARQRLKTLRDVDDGFAIADVDLRLRGPGEVLGVRQSGLPPFRFADLARDADLFVIADEMARKVVENDEAASARNLLERLDRALKSPSNEHASTEQLQAWH